MDGNNVLYYKTDCYVNLSWFDEMWQVELTSYEDILPVSRFFMNV
jgi:hypothetical protein